MRIILSIIVAIIFHSFAAHAQKDEVNLTLYAKDNNYKPVNAICSVSICDADVVVPDSSNARGMAEILLCSEIRGAIENPNYYFDKGNPQAQRDLDLLLMTQGWRRYDLTDMLQEHYPKINHNIEETQTISGKVSATLKRMPRNMKLLVLNPQTLARQTFELGDSSRFVLKGLDMIDGESMMLEATKNSGGTSMIQLEIDPVELPRLHASIDENKSFQKKNEFVKQSQEYLTYMNADKMIELPDVEVKGKKKVWKNRKGYANRGIQAGDPKLERFSDMQSMLRWLGLQLRINEYGETYFGKAAPTFAGNSFILTPVYIDDHIAEQEELWNIPTAQVEQIEYLTPNDPSNSIYSNDAVLAGCVLLYTKTGYDSRKAKEKKLNVESVKPLGYQPPVEFYSPQYPLADKTEYSRPDRRTTLYWNPKVKFGDTGKTTITFYNSDVSKQYLITIEGISEEGELVSKQFKTAIK